jgi:Epoxide hydrolase N terminus
MTQTATQGGSQQAADNNAIRPFQVDVVPEAELTELRRRINATRWPERETVADASQGVQLATTQALARYWATEYDWRKCESRLQGAERAYPKLIHYNKVEKGGHFCRLGTAAAVLRRSSRGLQITAVGRGEVGGELGQRWLERVFRIHVASGF